MASQDGNQRQITCKGKEYLDRTAKVLTEAFVGDPVFTWLLQDYSLTEQEPVLYKFIHALLTAGALNNAMFAEIDNFGCCCVLMPPGKRVDNPWTMIPAGIIPALFSIGFGGFRYSNVTHDMHAKVFTKAEQKKHWYLFIMGTSLSRRRQGLASELLVYAQNQARNDGRPIWLEATTGVSRDLYLKHGFTTVSEVILGKGKVGSDGLPRKGGEGVTIWLMFWRP
ncbi:putative increased recombination centers protein 11 [Madurella mycetomatis]|uniref:Putative increased recombination centers protein 11 n=1 Tax=Madurella mycetomatis TaxID=100816 RepID=A0A175W422_9PEZI|nr:putative increased recombination centers protein 11 [Madurella mycetomatis]KXX77764.1 putative increased recombination centers protein 11 [Madurella mycetomatis]